MKLEQPYEVHHEHSLGLVEMSDENHSPHDSPPHDYASNFEFTNSTHANYEQTYSSAPYQTSFSAPQPLHPLNTTLWPSQLTNPSGSSPPGGLPLHARPLAPVSHDTPAPPVSEPTPPPPKQTPTLPTSRKTLTDNDRRRMCRYHEENPTIKQTEIGGKSIFKRRIFLNMLMNFLSHVWS